MRLSAAQLATLITQQYPQTVAVRWSHPDVIAEVVWRDRD